MREVEEDVDCRCCSSQVGGGDSVGEVGVLPRVLLPRGAGVGPCLVLGEGACDCSVGGHWSGVGGRGLCLLSPEGERLGCVASPGEDLAAVGGGGRALFLPLSLLAGGRSAVGSIWNALSLFLS